MNIDSRLRRIESRAARRGFGCAYCRDDGNPPRRVVLVVNGEELGEPSPEACAVCRERVLIRRVRLDGLSTEQAAIARSLAVR